MEEKAEKGSEITVRVRLESIEKSPHSLYANVLLINHTPYDFTFHFGKVVSPTEQMAPVEGAVELEAKAVARVTVPVVLIKRILAALDKNIAIYEASYGKLLVRDEQEEK